MELLGWLRAKRDLSRRDGIKEHAATGYDLPAPLRIRAVWLGALAPAHGTRQDTNHGEAANKQEEQEARG
jgi:hypothetical protein